MENDVNLFKSNLKNGLTYYLYNNSINEDSVRIALVVKTGSLMEDSSENGIAHFTEHMCIYNELSDKEQKMDVNDDSFQGHTNFEETTYYLKCYKNEICEKLKKIKNILLGSNIKDSTIEEVRRGLVEEINKDTLRVETKLRKKIIPVITNGQISSRYFPIGELINIKSINCDSIRKFHNKWYKPANASIIIVGNIDKEHVKKLILQYFSEIDSERCIYKERVSGKCCRNTKILINTFNEIHNYELQIYFPTAISKYSCINDLYKNIIEYFKLKFIEYYFAKYFVNNKIEFIDIKFRFERLTSKFCFNVFQCRFKDNFNISLKAVFEIIKKTNLNGITENDFVQYKNVFIKELENSFKNRKLVHNKILVYECVDNFLYGDPILSLEYEYNFIVSSIEKFQYKKFNSQIKKLIINNNAILVINGQADLSLNKGDLNNYKLIISS